MNPGTVEPASGEAARRGEDASRSSGTHQRSEPHHEVTETHWREGGLFGRDMLSLADRPSRHGTSVHDTALHFLTHGGRYPLDQARDGLGPFDRAAFEALERHKQLSFLAPKADGDSSRLVMYASSLGRFRIRRASHHSPDCQPQECLLEIGSFHVAREILAEIEQREEQTRRVEDTNLREVKRAFGRIATEEPLAEVVEQIIDHVEHVEAVAFYVGDTIFARVERFNNLTESKGRPGFLTKLRDRPLDDWSDDEVLIAAALHSLFLSGRAVRFEEFNGTVLTATVLQQKLRSLALSYRDAGSRVDIPVDADLFQLAAAVRTQSQSAVGSGWLRYRWIYGLNFRKTERIIRSPRVTEDPAQHLKEFSVDYEELVGHRPSATIAESVFFSHLARAALHKDLGAELCHRGSGAAVGFLEYLIERLVASAVLATNADYGMSSSIRDAAGLVEPDSDKLDAILASLNARHFFTCFVSRGFHAELERAEADAIAASVQRRMMFNRWHFIPGNRDRARIPANRHWYYPPVVPDLAIHSDVHHGAHAQARVKYSVRAPGPDMAMSPLLIAGQAYRGFYDVRVVRTSGAEFTLEEMLRTRRRTLWTSQIYAALVEFAAQAPEKRRLISGFQLGQYLDLPPRSARSIQDPTQS